MTDAMFKPEYEGPRPSELVTACEAVVVKAAELMWSAREALAGATGEELRRRINHLAEATMTAHAAVTELKAARAALSATQAEDAQ
jgi:hypothetical protein